MKKAAQDMSYWDTTVTIERSEGEITALLRRKGAANVGTMLEDEPLALLVGFRWGDEPYRIKYKPLAPDYERGRTVWGKEEKLKKKAKLDKKAIDQMGRIALNHVKVLLAMALEGNHEEMLLPYTSLPGAGPTLQELGKDGFMRMLHNAEDGLLALPGPSGDGMDCDYVEAEE